MASPEYWRYIRSDEWDRKKAKTIKRDKSCRGCYSHENLQAHHLTYRNFGFEKPEDLVALCHSCHAKIHRRFDGYRKRDKEAMQMEWLRSRRKRWMISRLFFLSVLILMLAEPVANMLRHIT